MATLTRRRAAWPLLAISGLSLVVAWVLASPVGASPDEAEHIAYAWATVTGQTMGGEHMVSVPTKVAVNGRVVTVPGDHTMVTQVRMPQKLLQYPAPICYEFNAAQPTSSCLPIPPDTQQLVTQTSVMSRYPPMFYVVDGVVLRAATAVDLSGPRVLYAARLAAGLMSWLAVAFGVLLLARRFPARVVLLATLLGLPAMAWFLAASVNSNGLEAAAAFLLAAAVLSVRVDHFVGTRSLAAILAVPLGTLLLAWTRPLSWVWASLILALLLVPTGRRRGESWRQRLPIRRLGVLASTASAVVLASSMVWFIYALRVPASEHGTLVNPASWAQLSPVGRVILVLLHTGSSVTEQIGTFGWLDTPLPAVAVLAWVSITGAAVAVWSVGRSLVMPRWSVAAVLVLGYLAAMLDEYRQAWGWQGRYLLPIAAAVCVFAIPGVKNGFERWTASRRVVPWMLVVLMAVNALSVVWFLFRNMYGVKTWPRRLPVAPLPVGTPGWVPPFGVVPVLALVILALACGVGAVWTLPSARMPQPQPQPVLENADQPSAGQTLGHR